MKVRITDPSEMKRFGSAEFVVLALEFGPDGLNYRITPDESSTPYLFEASKCEITDGRMPSSWQARSWRGGIVDVAPPEWLEDMFWHRFFDRDARHVDQFLKWKEEIEKES